MKIKNVILFLLCIALLTLTGCTGMSREETEKIKTSAEPITENILIAINEENYEKFSRDFNEDMKKALDESKFKQLTSMLKNKIGTYSSKEFWKVDKGKLITVFFKAKYDKESGDVIIRSVLSEENDKYKVAGFFLDSPNLRKK